MNIRFTGENFEYHWGFIIWKGKNVLDIGADFGSTAECFLTVGANKVYASEPYQDFYNQLLEYSKRDPRVVPNQKFIANPSDFVELFNIFKPDIAKIDCEGAEIHLIGVPDEILRSIKEYAIECHSKDISDRIEERFKNLDYEIVEKRILDPSNYYCVLYVRNKN